MKKIVGKISYQSGSYEVQRNQCVTSASGERDTLGWTVITPRWLRRGTFRGVPGATVLVSEQHFHKQCQLDSDFSGKVWILSTLPRIYWEREIDSGRKISRGAQSKARVAPRWLVLWWRGKSLNQNLIFFLPSSPHLAPHPFFSTSRPTSLLLHIADFPSFNLLEAAVRVGC